MAMMQMLAKLRPLVTGGAAAVGALRKRWVEQPANHGEARLFALEKSLEIQAELNETVDMQIIVLRAQIVKLSKTLRAFLVLLIATATVAALALAAALMR